MIMHCSETKNSIGYSTSMAIVIASMIGTGVFTTLGFQAQEIQMGFALMCLWGLGGLIAMAGALSYGELSAALPRSGVEYHFPGFAAPSHGDGGPRVLQVAGEDLPGLRPLAVRTREGAPLLAIILQQLLAIAFVVTDSFEGVLLYAGFTLNLIALLTVAGVFVLRYTAPDLPCPYRVWGYPFTPACSPF